MLTLADAKRLIHGPVAERTDQLLVLLAVGDAQPSPVKEIRSRAAQVGLRTAHKWNFSAILSRSRFAARLPNGWELTEGGKDRVRSFAGLQSRVISDTGSALRKQAQTLTHADTINFLEEAISSLEHGNLRAAVVLSWVGAIALLHNYVVNNKISEFNVEAQRRDSKWKIAKTADDIGRMKEYEFLQVLHGLSIIGKNVKAELENCLSLRNSCGHPNSLKFAENRVAAHIEILLLNVYSRFG